MGSMLLTAMQHLQFHINASKITNVEALIEYIQHLGCSKCSRFHPSMHSEVHTFWQDPSHISSCDPGVQRDCSRAPKVAVSIWNTHVSALVYVSCKGRKANELNSYIPDVRYMKPQLKSEVGHKRQQVQVIHEVHDNVESWHDLSSSL
jgi:hypothetical protein